MCPPHFIVNVTLNREKAITGLYAGNVQSAHEAGCAAAMGASTVSVPRRYPVVVTTNSGYPLDQNFYQTVKGISAATRIVERGGKVIVASRCNLGLPDEGEFAAILSSPDSNEVLHATIQSTKFTRQDQWQVQTLLQALEKASVTLFSELTKKDRARTRTQHTDDLLKTLKDLGSNTVTPVPIAILPLGPLCIPILDDSKAL
jgi:nickel-dependent lactate racemase